MGPGQRYDLVNESDDLIKEEPYNDNPLNSRSARTPWWKFALYMLLAASAGMGAAFGVILASKMLEPSGSTSSAAATTTAAAAASSTTASADSLIIPTTASSVDHVEDEEETDGEDGDDSLVGQILDCGYSPEEAREKGCVYDVMMQDWVPEPCYDGALTERYLAEGNYTWYADFEGNVMSDEEMRKGEHHEAWMTGNYHKAHCIFAWEKLIRAMRHNRPLSQELVSYDHVLHCRHQTLGEEEHHHMKREEEGIAVRAPTNYAKCALYRTWQTDFIPDKHESIGK